MLKMVWMPRQTRGNSLALFSLDCVLRYSTVVVVLVVEVVVVVLEVVSASSQQHPVSQRVGPIVQYISRHLAHYIGCPSLLYSSVMSH